MRLLSYSFVVDRTLMEIEHILISIAFAVIANVFVACKGNVNVIEKGIETPMSEQGTLPGDYYDDGSFSSLYLRSGLELIRLPEETSEEIVIDYSSLELAQKDSIYARFELVENARVGDDLFGMVFPIRRGNRVDEQIIGYRQDYFSDLGASTGDYVFLGGESYLNCGGDQILFFPSSSQEIAFNRDNSNGIMLCQSAYGDGGWASMPARINFFDWTNCELLASFKTEGFFGGGIGRLTDGDNFILQGRTGNEIAVVLTTEQLVFVKSVSRAKKKEEYDRLREQVGLGIIDSTYLVLNDYKIVKSVND